MKQMRMDDLVQQLCAGYCSFYKPGKDEELACKGFSIFKKLLEAGKRVPARVQKTGLSTITEDELFSTICRTCPFYGQDCDFAAWKIGDSGNVAHESVSPCGGFLCLEQCIDQGAVDMEDINRVI